MPTAVIDFETTGLSPAMGDRATEIAIVMVEDGRVVDRFQSLMNPGVRISAFIEAYTGISNEMIEAAPPAEQVMAEAVRFVGNAGVVAHNAGFDRRFWEAEVGRLGGHGEGRSAPTPALPRWGREEGKSEDLAGRNGPPHFACTMLLSRRLYPEARSFRLGALAAFHDIEFNSRAHRAMADAEVTAKLLMRIQRDLERRWDVWDPTHELLVKVGKAPKKKVAEVIRKHREAAEGGSPGFPPSRE